MVNCFNSVSDFIRNGVLFLIKCEDKRYPPLRDGANSPLKNGYDLIHPNCRCEFRAYFEVLHSSEENEAKRRFSNRPFEGDKRTAEQARAYQEWQNVQRRAIDEQSRWNEMQATLGKENPYSDIGALRRALRSDKDSFAYKKSHYAVRDYKQYKRWKSVLGEDNMPKNLADFQDLKYNKNKSTAYEKLLQEKNQEIDYLIAKSGGAHSGKYDDFRQNYSDKQLEKSIVSYNKTIEEHKGIIKNPKLHCPDWDSFDERYKAGLIRKWEKDIRRNEAERNIAVGILKRRIKDENK